MYKIGNLGKFEVLPEMALLIYKGKAAELDALLSSGRDVQEKLALGKYSVVTPLVLALILNQLDVVKVLVERGAELNDKENPAFLLAVRYGDEPLIRYVHEQGSKLNMLNRVKSSAYDEAYYGNKHNIPLIRELGLDIVKYGGKTLRSAVSEHDLEMVDYLLKQGVDINYNQPDMVYPYKATPLTIAARMNNLALVKYLVERGADVTLTEKDGERAYTIAVTENNTEMAEYLKAQEPPDFHSLSNKLHALKGYGLPAPLVEFLQGDNLRVLLSAESADVRYVQFFSLVDTIEMKVGRQKLLRLSAELDNYSHLLLVWDRVKKGIGYYDIEHQEYGYLGKYADFQKNPELFINNMLA